MPGTETPKLDQVLLLAVPASMFWELLWFSLPGYGLEFGWGWAPVLVFSAGGVAYAALAHWIRAPRAHLAPRAIAIGFAGAAVLFTGLHFVNRFADRSPAAPERVEVTHVDRPFGRYSGYTEFRRFGLPQTYSIESSWGVAEGKALSVTFHPGLLGWAWVDEPHR